MWKLRQIISTKKTEGIHKPGPGKPYVEANITINGQRLKVVEKFTYFGNTFSKCFDDEVSVRLGKASSALGRLNRNVWSQRDISEATKISVYRAVVVTPTPLWLSNMDYLSTAYKVAKPLPHILSQENFQHHIARTHPQPPSYNPDFSSQQLNHLDAIPASLGRSCFPHERSLPPVVIALRRTVSRQALPWRPKKVP